MPASNRFSLGRPWGGANIQALAAAGLMLAILATSTGSADARRIVRIGVYENKPKVFRNDDGEPDGIFIDLIQMIAAAEDWELEYVSGQWGPSLRRLEAGEIDLMPDVSWSPKRTAKFAFNDVPVLSDWFEILAAPGRDIQSVLDLRGLKVAVLEESVQAASFAEMVTGFGLHAQAVPMPDYATGLEWLAQERVDALVANRYLAQDLGNHPDWKQTRVVYNPTRLHFAAPLSGRTDLLNAIDERLVAWKDDPDSIYYQTLRRWTGDGPHEVLPAGIRWLLGGGLGLALFALGIAATFRWQVQRRTRDLHARTQQLEQALAELDRARQKAIQQERLQILGELVSGLVHDFNNVLAPITLYAEILLDDPTALGDRELTRQHLEGIVGASSHGAEIVDRMRRLYRKQDNTDPVSTVDASEVVSGVLPIAEIRLKQLIRGDAPPIELNADLPRGHRLLAGETELRQAVLNLLLNAADAMPEGGRLGVSVGGRDDVVEIAVTDTGIGMDDATIHSCLEAFYTTKGDQGTGMGLAVVKALCDRYGGRVEVDSEPGAGSTFRLLFPAAPTANPATTVSREQVRSLRILAVDDEPRALEVLRSVLAADGHHVVPCSDPREAVTELKSAPYDLLLTDRTMPGLSGEQLARAAHELRPGLPVVLLSGTLVDSQTGPDDSATSRVRLRLAKPLRLSRLRQALLDLGFEQPPE